MADDQNCCTKKRTQKSESKWCELPMETAELILKKLASIDILRFKAVCSSWIYAANSYIAGPHYKPLPQSPWLVLGKDQEDDTYRFLSIEERKLYTIKNKLFQGCCIGSSYGWLVIMNKHSIINLLNPVSGESIPIPDIRDLLALSNVSSSSQVLNVVLSSEPSRQNTFFLAIRTMKNLATFKHEDKAWSTLLVQPSNREMEIVFHNHKLFTLRGNDVVHVMDCDKSVNPITVYILARCWPSDRPVSLLLIPGLNTLV